MNNLAFVDQIHVQFACQVARGHGGRGGGGETLYWSEGGKARGGSQTF